MKILNLIMSSKVDWLKKLKGLEDVSVGVYIKARAEISDKEKNCKFYASGLLAQEYGIDEIDEVYLDELESIGFVKTKKEGDKLILILGENFQWYTDGPTKVNEQMDFIRYYSKLCAEYDIPNDAVNEPKTHKMIKVIRSYENWKEKLEFVFKNWRKFLSKELSVGRPTLNVLSSQFYWRRIESAYSNKPMVENLGNRYDNQSENSEFEFKKPTIS